jgi:hypothetical protein
VHPKSTLAYPTTRSWSWHMGVGPWVMDNFVPIPYCGQVMLDVVGSDIRRTEWCILCLAYMWRMKIGFPKNLEY